VVFSTFVAMRWFILLLFVSSFGFSEDQLEVPEAPAIEFRELAWFGPTLQGGYGCFPGQDGTPMPTTIGRIEKKRLLGKQQLVWEHRFYDIQSVLIDEQQTVYVAFELGTLSLRLLEHRSWDVFYQPKGQPYSRAHFITFSSQIVLNQFFDPRVISSTTLPNN
jgi:hypothetical protein